MSGTITQVYVMLIIGTREGQALIKASRKDEIISSINGYLKSQGHTPLLTNGTENHLHLFLKMKDEPSLDALAKDIKIQIARQYNRRHPGSARLVWTKDYAAFSYSPSQIPEVMHYLQNEDLHHQRYSFEEEFLMFLRKFGVAHDPAKVFPYLQASVKPGKKSRIQKMQEGLVLRLF